MPRYVAFLRGVSPLNAKMPELKRSFEAAGFSEVKTVLSSGNVVFSTRGTSETAIERRAETAMQKQLGKLFQTIVRQANALKALLDADPYSAFELPPASKRVVTFLHSRPAAVKIELPLELEGASIFAVVGREILSTCVPGPRGSALLTLIEKKFGKNVTSRTLETVRKCVLA
jgi:uncharacterized protein (DUF1697 family)